MNKVSQDITNKRRSIIFGTRKTRDTQVLQEEEPEKDTALKAEIKMNLNDEQVDEVLPSAPSPHRRPTLLSQFSTIEPHTVPHWWKEKSLPSRINMSCRLLFPLAFIIVNIYLWTFHVGDYRHHFMYHEMHA